MFFQELCVSKVGWDEPLTGQLLARWNTLLSGFKGVVTSIPRCYFWSADKSSSVCSLHGFCDASSGAYAAVVYVKVEASYGNCVNFVASKTRVAPVNKQTIPRLELLSALLLANLVDNVFRALNQDLVISSITCYTDSKVSLYWIKGVGKEWKPFIQNRVNGIRKLVAAEKWTHCRGEDNPADIPSRGVTPMELAGSTLGRHGLSWLINVVTRDNDGDTSMPEECKKEMRVMRPSTQQSLLITNELKGISHIINCECFSTLRRLLRVTAYVLRFCETLKNRVKGMNRQGTVELTAPEIAAAETLWVKESQVPLRENKLFKVWEKQLGLFLSGGVWYCKGRLDNADIPQTAKHPALLNKEHYLTTLIIQEAHSRVMHNGIKETLTQLRSRYWLIRGRQFVKKIIHKCVTCRRSEGLPYKSPPPPPLPKFRVSEQPAFTYTAVDFAGPLYVKTQGLVTTKKVWICLYTCCVVRAVHLDLVPSLTADSFLHSFRRFTARRGFPHKMVSDNGKTFKAAAKSIQTLLNHSNVQQYSADVGMDWCFNLEKAPWWGGVFERMIKSAKICLKKSVGRARLTYDELLTVLAEVEMILNSRPLSYVSSEDIEEPLTPSHLLIGHRVLNLPDTVVTCSEGDIDEDIDVSQESLSKRARHLSVIMEHFWKRWKTEYLLQLREYHRHCNGDDSVHQPRVGDVVVVHDDNCPRGFWKLAKVESLLKGADELVRGAAVRVSSKGSRTSVLRRPLKCLYPLEIECQVKATQSENVTSSSDSNQEGVQHVRTPREIVSSVSRPRRAAAMRARNWMKTVLQDEL